MGTLELTTAQREKERKLMFKFVLLSLLGSAMIHAIAMAVPTPGVWQQAEAEDDEMEVVIENAEEPPKVEETQEVVQEPEPEVAPESQEVAFAPDVAPPPPLAPDTQAPLAPGEDAPSNQPPSPNSDALSPLTSTTGDMAVEKGGSGPITSPDGNGNGFGNATVPTGFNPAGRPDGDVKGVPGGIPGGTPGGRGNTLDGKLGGTPGGTGTQTTSKRPTLPPPIAPAVKPKLTCLECPKPKYRGTEGDPKVTYNIAPDGRVTNVRLRKSSGNADTDRETLETMGKWRFDPKTVPEGGRSNVRVRVTFEEEGSAFQRQNEQRRRESDLQRVAEENRQRREAERKAPAPAAAIDPPAKPAPAPVAAPEPVAPAPVAPPPPAAYEPPPAPAYEPPPAPVYEPPPAPEPVAPPPTASGEQ